MIVAEKEPLTVTSYRITTAVQNPFDRFGEAMPDGRLTEPSDGKQYRLRDAIMYSRQLGRPLTDSEMAKFEV